VTVGSGEPNDNIYEERTTRYAGFSESDLVEKPAINLFAELGWQTANFWGEFRGSASLEGRQSKREAILRNRLRLALRKVNPDLTETSLDEAYSVLTRNRGAIDPKSMAAFCYLRERSHSPDDELIYCVIGAIQL
jgi:type I restriction and modification enzyme subunit R-like protein